MSATVSKRRRSEANLSNFDFRNPRKVLLIVDTISQHVSKVAQRPLERVRRALLLRLLKGRGFALAILDVPVADVLVGRPVLQADSDDHGEAEGDLAGRRALVDEVDLDLLDRARPAVEAEDLVGQVDALLGRQVVHLLARRAGPRRDELGPQLLVEARLQGGDLLRGVLAHARLGLVEGVRARGTRVVLVARPAARLAIEVVAEQHETHTQAFWRGDAVRNDGMQVDRSCCLAGDPASSHSRYTRGSDAWPRDWRIGSEPSLGTGLLLVPKRDHLFLFTIAVKLFLEAAKQEQCRRWFTTSNRRLRTLLRPSTWARTRPRVNWGRHD